MTEINTFSDQDCGRIARVVRNAENKVNTRFEKRPPPKLAAEGGAAIEYTIDSIRTAGSTGDDAPYSGLVIATVTVKGASSDSTELIGTSVDVVDHSGGIFDLVAADLLGLWGWASEKAFQSLAPGAAAGDLTPLHWSATDRLCTAGGA